MLRLRLGRGKGRVRAREPRRTPIARGCPTLGITAVMTLKSRALLPQPGDGPRARTGQVVPVADEAELAGQSRGERVTSGQSDLVPATMGHSMTISPCQAGNRQESLPAYTPSLCHRQTTRPQRSLYPDVPSVQWAVGTVPASLGGLRGDGAG